MVRSPWLASTGNKRICLPRRLACLPATLALLSSTWAAQGWCQGLAAMPLLTCLFICLPAGAAADARAYTQLQQRPPRLQRRVGRPPCCPQMCLAACCCCAQLPYHCPVVLLCCALLHWWQAALQTGQQEPASGGASSPGILAAAAQGEAATAGLDGHASAGARLMLLCLAGWAKLQKASPALCMSCCWVHDCRLPPSHLTLPHVPHRCGSCFCSTL